MARGSDEGQPWRRPVGTSSSRLRAGTACLPRSAPTSLASWRRATLASQRRFTTKFVSEGLHNLREAERISRRRLRGGDARPPPASAQTRQLGRQWEVAPSAAGLPRSWQQREQTSSKPAASVVACRWSICSRWRFTCPEWSSWRCSGCGSRTRSWPRLEAGCGTAAVTMVVGRIASRRHRTLRGRGIAGAVPPGRIGAARGTGLEGCALPLWRNSADRARIAGLTPSRRARRPDAHAPDSRQTRHGAWRHARPPHSRPLTFRWSATGSRRRPTIPSL